MWILSSSSHFWSRCFITAIVTVNATATEDNFEICLMSSILFLLNICNGLLLFWYIFLPEVTNFWCFFNNTSKIHNCSYLSNLVTILNFVSHNRTHRSLVYTCFPSMIWWIQTYSISVLFIKFLFIKFCFFFFTISTHLK